ncbi:Protein masquerade, partial [Fragariocoptes setiger]
VLFGSFSNSKQQSNSKSSNISSSNSNKQLVPAIDCPGVCRNIVTAPLLCRHVIRDATCHSAYYKCCEKDDTYYNGTPVETSPPLLASDVDNGTTNGDASSEATSAPTEAPVNATIGETDLTVATASVAGVTATNESVRASLMPVSVFNIDNEQQQQQQQQQQQVQSTNTLEHESSNEAAAASASTDERLRERLRFAHNDNGTISATAQTEATSLTASTNDDQDELIMSGSSSAPEEGFASSTGDSNGSGAVDETMLMLFSSSDSGSGSGSSSSSSSSGNSNGNSDIGGANSNNNRSDAAVVAEQHRQSSGSSHADSSTSVASQSFDSMALNQNRLSNDANYTALATTIDSDLRGDGITTNVDNITNNAIRRVPFVNLSDFQSSQFQSSFVMPSDRAQTGFISSTPTSFVDSAATTPATTANVPLIDDNSNQTTPTTNPTNSNTNNNNEQHSNGSDDDVPEQQQSVECSGVCMERRFEDFCAHPRIDQSCAGELMFCCHQNPVNSQNNIGVAIPIELEVGEPNAATGAVAAAAQLESRQSHPQAVGQQHPVVVVVNDQHSAPSRNNIVITTPTTPIDVPTQTTIPFSSSSSSALDSTPSTTDTTTLDANNEPHTTTTADSIETSLTLNALGQFVNWLGQFQAPSSSNNTGGDYNFSNDPTVATESQSAATLTDASSLASMTTASTINTSANTNAQSEAELGVASNQDDATTAIATATATIASLAGDDLMTSDGQQQHQSFSSMSDDTQSTMSDNETRRAMPASEIPMNVNNSKSQYYDFTTIDEMTTSTEQADSAQRQKQCAGTCFRPLFDALCSRFDPTAQCANGNRCCIDDIAINSNSNSNNANDQLHTASNLPSTCGGTCLLSFLSALCPVSRHYEIVGRTADCGPSLVCCAPVTSLSSTTPATTKTPTTMLASTTTTPPATFNSDDTLPLIVAPPPLHITNELSARTPPLLSNQLNSQQQQSSGSPTRVRATSLLPTRTLLSGQASGASSLPSLIMNQLYPLFRPSIQSNSVAAPPLGGRFPTLALPNGVGGAQRVAQVRPPVVTASVPPTLPATMHYYTPRSPVAFPVDPSSSSPMTAATGTSMPAVAADDEANLRQWRQQQLKLQQQQQQQQQYVHQQEQLRKKLLKQQQQEQLQQVFYQQQQLIMKHNNNQNQLLTASLNNQHQQQHQVINQQMNNNKQSAAVGQWHTNVNQINNDNLNQHIALLDTDTGATPVPALVHNLQHQIKPQPNQSNNNRQRPAMNNAIVANVMNTRPQQTTTPTDEQLIANNLVISDARWMPASQLSALAQQHHQNQHQQQKQQHQQHSSNGAPSAHQQATIQYSTSISTSTANNKPLHQQQLQYQRDNINNSNAINRRPNVSTNTNANVALQQQQKQQQTAHKPHNNIVQQPTINLQSNNQNNKHNHLSQSATVLAQQKPQQQASAQAQQQVQPVTTGISSITTTRSPTLATTANSHNSNNNNNVMPQQQRDQCPTAACMPVSLSSAHCATVDNRFRCSTPGEICCVALANNHHQPQAQAQQQVLAPNNSQHSQQQIFSQQATNVNDVEQRPLSIVAPTTTTTTTRAPTIDVSTTGATDSTPTTTPAVTLSSTIDRLIARNNQTVSHYHSSAPNSCGVLGGTKQQRQPTGRVIGGSDAPNRNAWCWQAALMNSQDQYVCGGALIESQWVLTAAHCVTQLVRNGDKIFVRLGEFDLTEPAQPEQKHEVITTYIHHNHNSQTLDNDIALLKLKQAVRMSASVCRICLPERNSRIETGKYCTVTGYGYKHEDGPVALKIRQVQLPIVEEQECLTKTNAVTDKPFVLPSSSFCAGGELGQDACHGDGGSPFNCLIDDGHYELTGIVSWGFGCGRQDVPGVYAKVPSFVGWINQIVSVNTIGDNW